MQKKLAGTFVRNGVSTATAARIVVMPIVLSVLAVAFAALCVWLTVRIVNRRERWAKWTAVAAVGPALLYVLSFGPGCWWASTRPGIVPPGATVRRVPGAYWPIGCLAIQSPTLRNAANWYATLGTIDTLCLFSPNEAEAVVFKRDDP